MHAIFQMRPAELRALLDARRVRVGVVGFGYIGSCLGALLAERGVEVVGVDVDPRIVEETRRGRTLFSEPGLAELVARGVAAGRLTASSDFEELRSADAILVTVGTPLDDAGEPCLRSLRDAVAAIAKTLCAGQLVMVKSTLPVGVTEGVVRPGLERSGLAAGRDFGLVYSPERVAEGYILEELQSIPIVVGSGDPRSVALAAEFWESLLGVEVVRVSSFAAAEMVKLAGNLWIDVNVALANELGLLCDRLGVDCLEVIRASNTLPKGRGMLNILQPGVGVGGYCLTKDPWFLRGLAREHGLEMQAPVFSRIVNDAMPAAVSELFLGFLEAGGRRAADSDVAILGLAYKANTGDCRNSPVAGVVAALRPRVRRLAVFDPLSSAEEARTVTDLPMARSLLDAASGAHGVVVTAGHREILALAPRELAAAVAPGCGIFDARNCLPDESIAELRALGLRVRGVGRCAR